MALCKVSLGLSALAQTPSKRCAPRPVSRATVPDLASELRNASTPKYLGEQSAWVRQLVEWATSHPQLDAAHNKSTPSWLGAGQKVLSLDSSHGFVQVRAGIHDKQRMSAPDETLAPDEILTPHQLQVLQQKVANAIAARIDPGGRYLKPDKNWFQSVLRRDQSVVGVESPALREVPSWRPVGAEGSFRRGFIDLVGLDGHGDIRIVEAKIAKSSDDMTLMQGIDYYVWVPAFMMPSRSVRDRTLWEGAALRTVARRPSEPQS